MTVKPDAMNRRVLVVDDNPAIHRDFQMVLRRRDDAVSLGDLERELFGGAEPAEDDGYDLDVASQGLEGIERVRLAREAGRPYAVAFVDIRMPPGIDGIETARELWAVDPDLNVVICSAYSDHTWEQTVAALGAGDRWLVLRKPFDVIEVRQLASALVYKWMATREAQRRGLELESVVRMRTQEACEALARLGQETERRQRMEAELELAGKVEAVGRLAEGIARQMDEPVRYARDNIAFLRSAFSSLVDVLSCYRAVTDRLLGAGDDRRRLETTEQTADLATLVHRAPEAFEACDEGLGRVSRLVGSLLAAARTDHEGLVHAGRDEAERAR